MDPIIPQDLLTVLLKLGDTKQRSAIEQFMNEKK